VPVLVGLLACVLAATALTSEAEDWQPVTLVIALGVLMVVAETVSIVTPSTPRERSSGWATRTARSRCSSRRSTSC
jgi:hypothetical protein